MKRENQSWRYVFVLIPEEYATLEITLGSWAPQSLDQSQQRQGQYRNLHLPYRSQLSPQTSLIQRREAGPRRAWPVLQCSVEIIGGLLYIKDKLLCLMCKRLISLLHADGGQHAMSVASCGQVLLNMMTWLTWLKQHCVCVVYLVMAFTVVWPNEI